METKVPLWHLALLNPGMARARSIGEEYLIFRAYPGKHRKAVEGSFRGVIESHRDNSFPAADAYRVKGERFFPIRPSTPGSGNVAREFLSLAELPEKLEEAGGPRGENHHPGHRRPHRRGAALTLDANEPGVVG